MTQMNADPSTFFRGGGRFLGMRGQVLAESMRARLEDPSPTQNPEEPKNQT